MKPRSTMNPLRYCLSCWIPASKEKTEDAVIQDANEEEVNSDRSSLSSSHNAPPPPPPPSHVISSANAPSSLDAACPAPGAESLANETEATENYIALDKCFSGARPTKVQTMPRLVQRDFHLLDLVPPSPCSLRENLGSLSGMPEVYAPMSPHKISSRTARGSLGGVGAHAHDGSNKIQQMTPQGHRKELFTFEMKIPENQTSSNQSLKTDLQNGRTIFSTQADHGHRTCGRAEFQNRIPCTSISSDASSVEVRACHKPSETLHSLHGSSSTDHTDQPHYCNICVNPVDGVGSGGQSLSIDDAGEFSESDTKWHPSSSKSQGCSWQTEGAFKILHMTPQAPQAAQKNKLKLQKYVNTRSGADFDLGAGNGFENYPSVRNCPEESALSSCEGYYNILPTNSHSSRAEHASPPPPLPPPCHGHPGCMKKQLKPKLNPKDRQRSDSVILPVRKKSTNNDDSSSSNDEAELRGGSSQADSNTSLNNKFINSFQFNGFASKPPAPPPAHPQSIEYLQLDLDQPISGSRGSPNAVHHLFNSAPIDYIKIDPFRTKALSEAKKQLDNNRQNGKIPH